MTRNDGRSKRARLMVAGLFVLVALASAGCSGNALMNPQMDKAQGGQAAQGGSQLNNPGGQMSRP